MATLRRKTLLLVATCLALLLAACGGTESSSGDDSDSGQSAGETENQEGGETEAEGASEEEIADYFAGETIEFIVGYGPGGGYDIMSRMLAVHMPQYIPGEPDIIVQNVEGGASLNAARMASDARPDGLTVGVFSRHLTTESALGFEHEGFDPLEDMDLLGTGHASWTEVREWCTRADVASTFDEAVAAGESSPVTFGFQSVLPESAFVESLDLPFDLVYGYDALAAVFHAVDTGEVAGTGFCLPNQIAEEYPEWMENETVVPIFSLYDVSRYPDPKPNADIYESTNWERPPLLEDVFDLSEEQTQVLEVIRTAELAGVFNLGVPADTPDHIVEALREAVRLATEDSEYQADMNERGRAPGYKAPDEIVSQLEELRSYPEGVKATVLEMIKG